MKCNLKTAAALAAAIAVIGKALGVGIDVVTWMLVHACGLDWGHASAQAPVVLWTVVCILGALAVWVLFAFEEERSRKALSNHQPEYMQLPEHTKKGA